MFNYKSFLQRFLSQKMAWGAMGVAAFGAVIFGATLAYAQTNNTNRYSGLVQAVAQKFNIDPTQVQNVFNQYFMQQQSNRQQKMEQLLKLRLDTEVSQGKITPSQEQAILGELTSVKSKYNPSSFKNMTPAQRKQDWQNERSDLKSWANSQGINLSLIPGYGGMGLKGINHRWGFKPN